MALIHAVQACDYVSSFGWGGGGRDARAQPGLPGGGPELILTPDGVMDFEPESKHARLRHLAPGCLGRAGAGEDRLPLARG